MLLGLCVHAHCHRLGDRVYIFTVQRGLYDIVQRAGLADDLLSDVLSRDMDRHALEVETHMEVHRGMLAGGGKAPWRQLQPEVDGVDSLPCDSLVAVVVMDKACHR